MKDIISLSFLYKKLDKVWYFLLRVIFKMLKQNYHSHFPDDKTEPTRLDECVVGREGGKSDVWGVDWHVDN